MDLANAFASLAVLNVCFVVPVRAGVGVMWIMWTFFPSILPE